jgi:hypothetical protein
MHTDLIRRRHAIRAFANKFSGQPLQPHVIQREVWLHSGLHASEATIKRDIRAIIDSCPSLYSLHRGALVRAA